MAFSLLVLSITLTTSLGALEIARNFTVAVLWLGMLVVHLPFLLYRVVRLCTGAVAGRIEAGLRAWVFRREKAAGECELPAPRRRRNVFPPEHEKEVSRPAAAESEEEPEVPPEERGGETEVDEDGEEYTHVVVSRRAPQRVLSEKRSSKAAAKERAEREAAAQEWEERFKGYELPAVELLSPGETSPGGEDDEELLEKIAFN